MGVIVITGAMAAGKSTVAQAVAERLPRAAHVRGDVFRRMIVSGREDFGTDASAEAAVQLELRYALAATVADGYARAGFTAVVQDVILGPALSSFTGLIATRPRHVVVLAPRVEAAPCAPGPSRSHPRRSSAWACPSTTCTLGRTPPVTLRAQRHGRCVAGLRRPALPVALAAPGRLPDDRPDRQRGLAGSRPAAVDLAAAPAVRHPPRRCGGGP